MKTIIFLALISLSFAFIPKDFFNKNNPSADSEGFLSVNKDNYDSVNINELNNSTDDSLLSNNETESSDDYYIDYSLYSEDSDWSSNNVTNTTHGIWTDDISPGNDTNFTTSNNSNELYDYYTSDDEIDSKEEDYFNAILSSAIASLFNETTEKDALYILVKLIGIEDLNITDNDIYDIFNSTQFDNVSLLKDNETESSDDYFIAYGLYSDESDWNNSALLKNDTNSITSDSDQEKYLEAILSSAISSLFNGTIDKNGFYNLRLIDIIDLNITDEDNYGILNETQFDNITLLVFNMSLLQDNETESSDDYYDYGFSSDESDWLSNGTNSTQYGIIVSETYIPLLNETDYAAENNTDFTTSPSFRSSFENFTEALTDYLLSNIENNFEEDRLYDEVLSSIALLFNQTIEEKALFGLEQGEDN